MWCGWSHALLWGVLTVRVRSIPRRSSGWVSDRHGASSCTARRAAARRSWPRPSPPNPAPTSSPSRYLPSTPPETRHTREPRQSLLVDVVAMTGSGAVQQVGGRVRASRARSVPQGPRRGSLHHLLRTPLCPLPPPMQLRDHAWDSPSGPCASIPPGRDRRAGRAQRRRR